MALVNGLCMLTHLINATALSGRYYYSHFIDEETEVHRRPRAEDEWYTLVSVVAALCHR